MKELIFLLSAEIDIQEAYENLEDYQEGRGGLFMSHLDASFGFVRRFPEIAPPFYGRYRRLLMPRFPFGIFYSIESDRIVVSAVMNLHQDPAVIRKRLS